MIRLTDQNGGDEDTQAKARKAAAEQRMAQADKEQNAQGDDILGTAGGAIGGIIGAYFGGPMGAVQGFQAGKSVGKGVSELATDREGAALQDLSGGVGNIVSKLK